ncbi:VOC family protein [Nocardioides sp. dk4132]|uniref:VOC family protein n=1 Tax=unclassified Nocardioides TaxID=2615069 RepID=UPI001297A45E|nr:MULTISPECIES: VOC family protein [unclassified Nocardioides]MQW74845.1 VOC family protein [Nocardioides sp. dk4132]QGA06733.1 VOC family protein [Nocardioides sp. dk884]
MTHPTPYIHFPGNAREALTFYGDVFGCGVQVHTYAGFGRVDGPAEAVAHGMLVDGPVALFGADAGPDDSPLKSEGLMLSLLGAAAPDVTREWFTRLADGGRVVSDLQMRGWGATDGEVVDRYGLHWLLGFEPDAADEA